ncbi:MAG: T9SS type A sorting domain-containing protein [Bacteroidota bacterium]|jgi:hypothetical protein
MKKTYIALLGLMMSLSTIGFSQSGRTCGSMDHLQHQIAEDPTVETRMQQIENATSRWLSDPSHRTGAIITIPVVVHVVYNTAAQNISDAQVQSQIDVLNEDFRKLNADASLTPSIFSAVAADCQIQFCLAQRDPNGNATTGIIRKATTTTAFSTNDNMKRTANGGSDAWNTTQYLNIWSCNMSGGILGYAQFPGGTASTDGVVILYSAFGRTGTVSAPYNKGRTATHEVGHWLNLRHIWGDATCGSDLVNDTPTHNTANYGCPTYPHLSTCTGTPTEMTMNYMDYTDDACMYMFTAGQSARMTAAINTSRTGLLTSLGCTPPTPPTSCGTVTGLTSSSVGSTTATVSWTAVSGATSYSLQYRAVGSATWTSVTTSATSTNLTGLTVSTAYEFQVTSSCSGTLGTVSTLANFTTTAAAACGTPASLASSSITSSSATVSWGAVTGASSYLVQYRVSTSTTWTNSVTVTTASATLTGLTASTTYQYQVTATCSGTAGTASSIGTFTTSAASTTCNDVYESNNSRNTSKTIAINTDIFAKIGTSTDKDWFKFTTLSTAPKIKVFLDQLPADYDLALYNSTGSTLATSVLGGTSSETIIYNTYTTGRTCYIQVYGYASAFNANSCYRVRVSTSATNFRTADGSEENSNEIVSAEKVTGLEGLNLFPNPANTSLTINYFTPSMENTSIEIYDMMGQLVNSMNVNANEGFNSRELDLTSMSNGVYFLKVTQNNNTLTNKFVVKH